MSKFARSPNAWLFLIAAGTRLTYLFVLRPPFETTYWALAASLLDDGYLGVDGTPTTDYEPLYPMFLAALRWLARDHVLSVQVAQACFASLGAVYLYRLTYALTDRTRLAAIAGLLHALHPLLVRQAAQASDLAFVTTLLIAFAYDFVAARGTAGAALAGIVLGLALLARTMLMPIVPLAAAVLTAQRRVRAALALTVVSLVLVAPYAARNRSINGSLLPTRGGVNLYIGNSPYTAALLPDHDLDLLQQQAAELVEREMGALSSDSPQFIRVADALLTRYAVAYMAERPLRTLGRKALNVWYFFSPRLVPFRTAGRETRVVQRSGETFVENPRRRPVIEVAAYALFYTPVLIAAASGVYLRRRELSRDAILWCIVATFVAVHAVYVPATRYRAPMEFVLLFYASAAVGPVFGATHRERPSGGVGRSPTFNRSR